MNGSVSYTGTKKREDKYMQLKQVSNDIVTIKNNILTVNNWGHIYEYIHNSNARYGSKVQNTEDQKHKNRKEVTVINKGKSSKNTITVIRTSEKCIYWKGLTTIRQSQMDTLSLL